MSAPVKVCVAEIYKGLRLFRQQDLAGADKEVRLHRTGVELEKMPKVREELGEYKRPTPLALR